MSRGLFDAHPGAQVILGHFGELLPFTVWRTDHRVAVARAGFRRARPSRTTRGTTST